MNLALVSDNSSGVGPVFLHNGANLNQSGVLNGTAGEVPIFPSYIRTASTIVCVIIMSIGVAGNAMVPAVILRSRDMRNSTNIFLVNLSVADLLVLLVCTPTVLVEVHSRPEVWLLGETMCKAVPFVELTVAHASVLTILAISFERYYAICEPLRAGYVCTKARAMFICLLAWALAALLTSPVTLVAQYRLAEYIDGSIVPVCLMEADSFWPVLFFIATISLFFVLPLLILLVLYSLIAKNLMEAPDVMTAHQHQHHRYRKQVVLMLGTVVVSFFICLLPFRAFTLWIIVVPPETVIALGVERYYNLLYFCRIMHYINSALNPILYNLMSSKFRNGFARLCLGSSVGRKKALLLGRKGTATSSTIATTTTTSGSHCSWKRSVSSRWSSGKSCRGLGNGVCDRQDSYV